MEKKYNYNAKIIDIHDGDTLNVLVDLGFNLSQEMTVRLFGLNAPELRVRNENNKLVENVLGTKTLTELKRLIPIGSDVILETKKDKKEKYGRYLGIILKDGININNYLLENNLATILKY